MNLKVQGNQQLNGTITPSGSKNSAVALIPATILFKEKVILTNVPDISDVTRLLNILKKMGSKFNYNKELATLEIDNSEISLKNLAKEDLGNMRGTSLLWGPLLGRFGKVNFDELPGGCTLGARSLEPHYKAFVDLNVKVELTDKGVEMDSTNAMSSELLLLEMSPTVTENAVMLASTLEGTTTIYNAATETNVRDLCNFLIKAGAQIDGVGSNVLKVTGPAKFNSIEHSVIPDIYEITTFLMLGACTGGDVRVTNVDPWDFETLKREFEKFNVHIKIENGIASIDLSKKVKIISRRGEMIKVRAQPWPALPVDLLPLFIPLALKCDSGSVLFHNWMYESGLFWTSELQKLGATVIMCDPHRVIVSAGNKLKGAVLEAPYIIRAVVSLFLAATIAEGESTILNADAIYRGHPNFVKNLKNLGAKIEEIS